MAGPQIVLLPFMAQGHLIPFLALAKLIADRHPSATITIATTPLNAAALAALLPPNTAAIRLHPLPYQSSEHGLPPNIDNTDSISFPSNLDFYASSQSLAPHFDLLLSALSPALVIADVFLSWSVASARRLSIPHAVFTTCGAYGTVAYFSLYTHVPHLADPADPDFPVPGLPFRFHRTQLAPHFRAASPSSPWFRYFAQQIALSMTSDCFLCNTVDELEPAGLRHLRDLTKLPIYPVGPILGERKAPGKRDYTGWLAAQPAGSVVYVSFGSQNSVAVSDMRALAEGLERSGSGFLWVVRPPVGFDVRGEFRDEWLPDGFEGRVEGRGVVVRGWAPQMEILAHAATGAFLSHCGWNSVLESLSCGVPVIGWPLGSDQFCNSKVLEEEMGVGVEVARGVGAGVGREDVERVVREVVGGARGREMRERAAAAAATMRAAMREEGGEKGSSLRAVDEFLGKFKAV